jgi:tRNA threonylcarbamoyl adenosine modification protein (Sua5/YciO/YrdC/YwlC family)
MLLKIHPENISDRQIQRVVDTLQQGGIIIYPTDTVYGLGCDIKNQKAVEKIARLKGKDVRKSHFSFICHDLSHLSDYTLPIENSVFKLMKKNLPGPFTFILPAGSNVPKMFKNKKKTIGIRVPDNSIILEIVRRLGNPILSTSVHDDDNIIEYTADPEIIHDKYKKLVDIVVHGGAGGNIPSTVIDCTNAEPVVTREGKGELQF